MFTMVARLPCALFVELFKVWYSKQYIHTLIQDNLYCWPHEQVDSNRKHTHSMRMYMHRKLFGTIDGIVRTVYGILRF